MKYILWGIVIIGISMTVQDTVKDAPKVELYTDYILIATGVFGLLVRGLIISWKRSK